MTTPKPVILCILDGWGEAPAGEHNAISQANTPHWDYLKARYPHGVINASEEHVGLPDGQMGNSEVGHMNIGSGRVVMQDLPRIDTAIADGSLNNNPHLHTFIETLKQRGGACHLMGLVSPGGVHSHQRHISELANSVAKAGIQVWIHVFTDGRDTPPQSAEKYIKQFEKDLLATEHIAFATVSGRYFAMDRDQRWDRVEKAYSAIVRHHRPDAETLSDESLQQLSLPAATHMGDTLLNVLKQHYAHGKTDEFIEPTILGNYPGMHDGDGLLMANFRADRARELLSALLDPEFEGFKRDRFWQCATALGMIEYSTEHTQWMETLFPPQALSHILGEVVAEKGLKQLRIAETEKYAHVTFFFNGGKEEPFANEERILVPSPKVPTYDLQPEMSAMEVTNKLIHAIESARYELIIVNYANPDMVGHTGKMHAAITAVECIDHCLERLTNAIEMAGGAMLITADHGNIERMYDEGSQQSHTAHTTNLVPLILVEKTLKDSSPTLREGKLADIAPTLLTWLGVAVPDAMTGSSLLP